MEFVVSPPTMYCVIQHSLCKILMHILYTIFSGCIDLLRLFTQIYSKMLDETKWKVIRSRNNSTWKICGHPRSKLHFYRWNSGISTTESSMYICGGFHSLRTLRTVECELRMLRISQFRHTIKGNTSILILCTNSIPLILFECMRGIWYKADGVRWSLKSLLDNVMRKLCAPDEKKIIFVCVCVFGICT